MGESGTRLGSIAAAPPGLPGPPLKSATVEPTVPMATGSLVRVASPDAPVPRPLEPIDSAVTDPMGRSKPEAPPLGRPGPPASVVRRPTTTPSFLRPETTPSPQVLERCGAFVTAYRRESMRAANALMATGAARFSFWEGATRELPDGVMQGALRANASVWSVGRDIASGRLTIASFGALRSGITMWSDVTAADMYALAANRVRRGRVDLDALAAEMTADRTLPPLVVAHPERGELVLEQSNIDTFGRSPADVLHLTEVANGFMEHALVVKARELAISMADAKDSAAQQVSVAAAMFDGTAGSLPTTAGVLGMLAEATGTPIFTKTSVAETLQRWPEESAQGDILKWLAKQTGDGVAALPMIDAGVPPRFAGDPEARAPKGLLIVREVSPRDIAKEIRRRLDSGELAGLDPATRARIASIIGPTGQAGEALLARAETERKARDSRNTVSGYVGTGAVVFGGLAVGGVTAALASRLLYSAAGFSAGFWTYATVQGVTSTAFIQTATGHHDWREYPVSIALLRPLMETQRIAAQLAYRMGRASPAANLAAQTAALLGTSAVSAGAMTAVGSGLQAIDTKKLPGFDDALAGFARNMGMALVTHRLNMALQGLAPSLGPNVLVQREHQRLVGELSTAELAAAKQLDVTNAALARVGDSLQRLRRGDDPTKDAECVAAAQAFIDARARHAELMSSVQSANDRAIAFVARYAPAVAAQLAAATRDQAKPQSAQATEAAVLPMAAKNPISPGTAAKEYPNLAIGTPARGDRPEVVKLELSDGTTTFSIYDGRVRASDGRSFTIVAGADDGVLLRDQQGRPFALTMTTGATGKLVTPTNGYIEGTHGTAAFRDGKFFTIDRSNLVVSDETGRVVGLAGGGAQVDTSQIYSQERQLGRFFNVPTTEPPAIPKDFVIGVKLDMTDPYARALATALEWNPQASLTRQAREPWQNEFPHIPDEVVSPATLANGQAIWVGSSYVVTQQGVRRAFATSEDKSSTLLVDSRGAPSIIRVTPNGLEMSPLQDGPIATRYIREANAGPREVTVMSGLQNLARLLYEPKPAKMSVIDGRLVQVASRSGAQIAFDVDGKPVSVLKGAPPSRAIKGEGPMHDARFARDTDGQFVRIWESSGDAHLVQRPDGRWALATLDGNGLIGGLRDGLFPDGKAFVIEGKRFAVSGVSEDKKLIFGVGASERKVISVESGKPVAVVPAGTRAFKGQDGSLHTLTHDGVPYTVLMSPRAPGDNAPIADAVIGMLTGGRVLTHRQQPVVAKVSSALAAGGNVTFEKLQQLRAEIVAGDGPTLRTALGPTAMAQLEGVTGSVSSKVMPFVYAVRGGAPSTTPGSMLTTWSTTGARFDPADFAIFEPTAKGYQPVPVRKLQAHLDGILGSAVFRTDLPRPSRVEVVQTKPSLADLVRSRSLADDPTDFLRRLVGGSGELGDAPMQMTQLRISFGNEVMTIPMSARPSSIPADQLPTDAQIAAWIQNMPMQAVRELTSIKFVEEGLGVGTFNISDGELSFGQSRTGWHGKFMNGVAKHEFGHAIEQHDPLLYALLMEAAVLDARVGAKYAPRAYGELNPAEYFATLIEQYGEPHSTLATDRPNTARLLGAIYNSTGERTPPGFFRSLVQGTSAAMLALVIAQQLQKPEEKKPD